MIENVNIVRARNPQNDEIDFFVRPFCWASLGSEQLRFAGFSVVAAMIRWSVCRDCSARLNRGPL